MRRNDRGAITLFTLIAGLFFIAFLTSILLIGAVKRQAQLEATKQTESIYSQNNTNEIYDSYFGGDVVPIYTFAQLLEMCSGHEIVINEESGKYFTFSSDAIYILRNDLEGTSNGVLSLPPVAFTNNGRLEGNGKTIKIRDTSKTEETYYYYNNSNNYAFPLTKEGYSYLGLQIHYDGVNNAGNGHSNSPQHRTANVAGWVDISGNGNDAKITGITTPNWKTDCLETNKVESIETPFTLNSTYTIEVVITPLAMFNYNTIWDNTSNANIDELWIYSNSTLGLRASSGTNISYGTKKLTLQKTAMLTAVLDIENAIGKLYINGERVENNTSANLVNTSGGLLSFNGKNSGNTKGKNNYYNIKVYNRALTDDEIEQNYKVNKQRINWSV
ncbi:MAG: hypothetical protein IKP28_04545 [Clostridia bacterium]|nr:hypothetical protein [Clostridia bacterium]